MNDYLKHIATMEEKYNLKPGVLTQLIKQESGGNLNTTSKRGAVGLTQLMPDTAKELGVDPNDPFQNIEGGAKYLRQQLDKFGGKYSQALAAYNAGPNNKAVATGNWEMLPNETKQYVQKFHDAGFITKNQTTDTPIKPYQVNQSVSSIPEQSLLDKAKETGEAFLRGNSFTNPIAAGANSVVQGIQEKGLGGFLMSDTNDLAQAYEQNLKSEQQYDNIAQTRHPVASTLGDMVQSAPLYMLPGAGISKGLKSNDMLRKLASGAVSGATGSFTHGALTSDGRGTTGDERWNPIKESVVLGAGLGAGGAAAGEMGSMLFNKARNVFSPNKTPELIKGAVNTLEGTYGKAPVIGKTGSAYDVQDEAIKSMKNYKAEADKLYNVVDDHIANLNNPILNIPSKTKTVLEDVISNESGNFSNVPTGIRGKIGKLLSTQGFTDIVSIRTLSKDIAKNIRILGKSPEKADAVRSLVQIRNELDDSLVQWGEQTGNTELASSLKQANQYYKENVVPYKDGLLRDVTTKGKKLNPTSSSIKKQNIEKTVRDFTNPDTPYIMSDIVPKFIGEEGKNVIKWKSFTDIIDKHSNPVDRTLNYEGIIKDSQKLMPHLNPTEQYELAKVLRAMNEEMKIKTGVKIDSIENFLAETARTLAFPRRTAYRLLQDNNPGHTEAIRRLLHGPEEYEKFVQELMNRSKSVGHTSALAAQGQNEFVDALNNDKKKRNSK